MHRYFLKTAALLSILFTSVLLVGLFFASSAKAQEEHPEVKRTRGYEDYNRQKKLIEQERDRGLSLHLEKLEIEKREAAVALEEYRKIKRKEKPLEYTEAYQENLAERKKEKKITEEELEEFRADKKIEKRQLEQAHLNKMEELGLPEDRPRFDIKKRALYGATAKFGKSNQLGGGSSGGGGSFDGGGGSNYTPPPANSFDEFPPPPSFPGEDNFDLPPPPPPPPMPFDDGGMGNAAPFDDFPPPPPPPVEDFNF